MMSNKKRRMGIAQDGKKVQGLTSYGLLNTKNAECKQQNVELVQIRDLLRRELEDIKEKKKVLLEIAQNGNERTALSSYAVLQTKYAASWKEKVELIKGIGKLRGELEDFNRNEGEDIHYNKEEDNKSIIVTVVNVRKELEDMKETNEQLREGKAACFRDMEELRGKISKLSDAHELLVEENEFLKRRLEYFEVGLVGQRRMERD
jgi:FtsZ-binding cell division protein ZapB